MARENILAVFAIMKLMQKGAIHRASDLTPELRRAVEALLGEALEEDETIVLHAAKSCFAKRAPTGEQRDEAFRRLMRHLDAADAKSGSIPEEEAAALIEEALAHSRHHH